MILLRRTSCGNKRPSNDPTPTKIQAILPRPQSMSSTRRHTIHPEAIGVRAEKHAQIDSKRLLSGVVQRYVRGDIASPSAK